MKQLTEMHAVIRGRVQGVGFRSTVRHYAAQLGLCGIVRNLPDGSVEIYAQGVRENLDKLLEALRQHSGPAFISGMSLEYTSVKQSYPQFSVVHGE